MSKIKKVLLGALLLSTALFLNACLVDNGDYKVMIKTENQGVKYSVVKYKMSQDLEWTTATFLDEYDNEITYIEYDSSDPFLGEGYLYVPESGTYDFKIVPQDTFMDTEVEVFEKEILLMKDQAIYELTIYSGGSTEWGKITY